jgi:putative nucleotidyltransferase with HDIG domain
MSTSSNKRAGKERLQSLGLPQSKLLRWWSEEADAGFWYRLSVTFAAAVAMLVVCRCWQPPFPYRTGDYPSRDVISRVEFQVVDTTATEALRMQKRREALAYYVNRSQPLIQRREELKDQLFLILGAESFAQMTADERRAFAELYVDSETAQPGDTAADRFGILKSVLATDPDLQKTDTAVQIALMPAMETGLLQSLTHSAEQGDLRVIRVYSPGAVEDAQVVEVSKVRIAQARSEIEQRLKEQFRQRFDGEAIQGEAAQKVAQMVSYWLSNRLPETLRYDDELSGKARQEMADQVEDVMKTFRRGISVLAPAGQPLGPIQIDLLRREWEALTDKIGLGTRLARLAAYAGMIAALFLLGGGYIHFVDDRSVLAETGKLSRLLGLVVVTVSVCYIVSRDQWRAELIPLSMAATVATVVYGRELAMLLMAAISLAVTLFIGADIGATVMMVAAALSCVLFLGRIRSRTHLLYVGTASALVTLLTVIGVGVVTGELLTIPDVGADLVPLLPSTGVGAILAVLSREAVWAAGCVIVGAVAMTSLLPLVEKGFGVQTDLSLLELGDASHPLLRKLAQRAPGTYNHSINVASIAEAAADEIGANGLLVRVGAYFHDIGKMFKPDYFIENQSDGVNQHDSLQPAMSKLIIVAHVKDGADLARSNHLPQPIIDFILQHHGTTLVEYFYREAAKRSEMNPNREEVSDKDFRYPGPKPQTLEAAVLMLADTVESASRTLVEPTSARITHLVDAIATKKMADGQFDECGLTFMQLDQIKKSLVKSLTAIYHARVKYPGQQSA